MMREVIRRTLAVYVRCALVVWYGRGRIGKTTTARHMVKLINKAYDPDNPNTFRAVHYEVASISDKSGNEMKQGIKSLYEGTLGIRIDGGFYMRASTETIARHLVHALRRKGVRMVIVDEAGLLSIEAIRGIVLVRDIAEMEEWILSIIFVGMDDLPVKMTKNEQIHGRVVEWCMFESYSLDDTWALLGILHPYFKALDGRKQINQKLIRFIHDICGGLPGLIVDFIEKLRYRLNTNTEEITVEFLKAIHDMTEKSMKDAVEQSRRHYKGVRTGQASQPSGA